MSLGADRGAVGRMAPGQLSSTPVAPRIGRCHGHCWFQLPPVAPAARSQARRHFLQRSPRLVVAVHEVGDGPG